MTKEQEKAIKILNTISEKGQGQRVFWEEDLEYIRTILNLIQSQQKEIENKDNKIWQLKSQIQDLENECISLHELIDEGM